MIIVVGILLLQLWTIEGHPRTQRITVHGHEWTVPDEPGWEAGSILFFSSLSLWELVFARFFLVLQEAEPYRHHFLTNCVSSRDCRLAAEKLRKIFLKHPVSAKYYDDPVSNDLPPNDIDSIFKWG